MSPQETVLALFKKTLVDLDEDYSKDVDPSLYTEGRRDGLAGALRLLEFFERSVGLAEGPEPQDPWEAA